MDLCLGNVLVYSCSSVSSNDVKGGDERLTRVSEILFKHTRILQLSARHWSAIPMIRASLPSLPAISSPPFQFKFTMLTSPQRYQILLPIKHRLHHPGSIIQHKRSNRFRTHGCERNSSPSVPTRAGSGGGGDEHCRLHGDQQGHRRCHLRRLGQ